MKYCMMVSSLILLLSTQTQANEILNCDISNNRLQLREVFEIHFNNDFAKLVGFSNLCDTNPCVSENAKLSESRPSSFTFVATLPEGNTFQDTGTNKSEIMYATITPTRTAFAIKVSESGVAGQDGAALIYKGKCSLVKN